MIIPIWNEAKNEKGKRDVIIIRLDQQENKYQNTYMYTYLRVMDWLSSIPYYKYIIK